MSLLSFLFGGKKSEFITQLSTEEFRSQIQNKKVQLVDVRTPNEFKQGHIKKAINIDFFSGKFNVNFDNLNKNEAVYVYCRSGGRSRQTANKLAKKGFTEIYDLKGGYLRW
ncbi:MAG: rhodanese-like domain-containing protein [Flavobacteriaceae bacterium]|nr:rhodanese-like domain-containing protein [Flavobacteriaceae bacterium]